MNAAKRPDPAFVLRLLSRYAPVQLHIEDGHLSPNDRLALKKLVSSAKWIDRIYWKQRSEIGWKLKTSLSSRRDQGARNLERLLALNYGPWDSLDQDRSFWGEGKRPPGANFYPVDLTKEEFLNYVGRHPEQRELLTSHTTLVRRQGEALVAVPYEKAYAEELERIADRLLEASEIVAEDGLRAFLRLRASELCGRSLRESEALWVKAAGGPIDVVIGPYEVYDDALLGMKASYEAAIMVRHPMTARLNQLESNVSELRKTLPGAVAMEERDRRVTIGVYDLAFASGLLNMGSKAIAASLPNDEEVRANVGARLLLFRNVISAKFEPIMRAISERVLPKGQLPLIAEDAFLYHTLLHEMAHALSSGFVMQRNGLLTDQNIHEALGERYSTIEECRADLISFVFLELLANRGILRPDLPSAAAATIIVSSVRTARFGATDDHGRAAAIILSYLHKHKAFEVLGGNDLRLDIPRLRRGIVELAAQVQQISTTGDYKGAGELITDLALVPSGLSKLMARIEDVPVDLEFVFGASADSVSSA